MLNEVVVFSGIPEGMADPRTKNDVTNHEGAYKNFHTVTLHGRPVGEGPEGTSPPPPPAHVSEIILKMQHICNTG